MLRRFTIHRVMVGAMALLAILTCLGMLWLVLATSTMRRELARQGELLWEDQEIAERIVAHSRNQMDAAHRYADHGDTTSLAIFRAAGMAVYDNIRLYLFRDLNREERLLVEQIRESHERIEVAAQRVFSDPESSDILALDEIGALQHQLARLVAMRRTHTAELVTAQDLIWTWLYVALGAIAVLCLLAIGVATTFLRRRLVEPLMRLSEASAQVGEGQFHVRVEHTGAGEITDLSRSFNEMAERLQQARTDAADAEHRFRDLVERMPVGLYRTTADGNLLDANPALVRLLGYDSREDLLASNAADVYSDEAERAAWQGNIDASEGVLEVDRQHRRRDGSLLWLRDTAQAVRDEDGNVLYYEGALQDVTAHVATEEAVRRSEARFRSLIENASEGVIVLSPDATLQYQSPAVQRILGYEPQEMMGRSPFELVHPDDLAMVREAFEGIMTRATSLRSLEFRCRHRDGHWRVIHAYGSNLVDDDAISGFVINISDMTMHRRLEAELSQAQKMEAVGRLAGGVAHDFNNLLTAIQGYTELLRERTTGDDAAQSELAEIRLAADRAAALTTQLLAFSRRQVVRPRPTELGGIIHTLEPMLRRLITEDIPLHMRVNCDCWVQADPGQLEQVVINLAVNARDARPKAGITVIVEAVTTTGRGDTVGLTPGEFVRLDVSDDGCGIEADVLPHIFDPFFTTKGVGQGTGLGLATVYGIVEQNGGRVFVDSELGAGTRVTVYLPRVKAPTPTMQTNAALPQPAAGSERILLVEDEAAVRALVERVLTRYGYDVVSAQNGAAALEVIAGLDGSIDMLLTDVVMPDMGGVELAEALWQTRPDLRVLFISGYAAEALPRLSDGSPLNFLEKPFSPVALAEAVRRSLDSMGAAATS
jgi:two-component system, cell cycle sensor histidine kinase and response regulator CckA